MSNLLEQHIRIRLAHDILASANVIQGDTGRELYFVIDDYEVPDNAEYRIYLKKPSGKEIYNYCYYANGEVVVQLTSQMVAEAGDNYGQVQIISQDNVELTSFPFHLFVTQDFIESSSIVSKDEFGILDELITNARIAINQINSLNKTIAEQENERQENENNRKEAESDRVDAENNRVNEFNGIKDEFQDLKEEAITATNNANEAAQNADEKSVLAAQASENANNATQTILQKAENGDFSATVDVGIVSTGEPGTEVQVTNSGTTKDAIFNFVIPRGDVGPVGPKGETGSIDNLDTVPLEFEEAVTRENINSGETTSTIFGKIKKWFSDIRDSAFCYVTNNLLQTEAGGVLDARQGKVLADEIHEIKYNRVHSVEIVSLDTLFNNLPSSISAEGNMKIVNIWLDHDPSVVRLVNFSIQFVVNSVPSNYQISLGRINSSYILNFNSLVRPNIMLSCSSNPDEYAILQFDYSTTYVGGTIQFLRNVTSGYRYTGHGTWITDG